MWFIERDTVEECTDNFESSNLRKKVSIYDEGERMIGWINFVTENIYKTLAKVNIFTIAYELDEADFHNILN